MNFFIRHKTFLILVTVLVMVLGGGIQEIYAGEGAGGCNKDTGTVWGKICEALYYTRNTAGYPQGTAVSVELIIGKIIKGLLSFVGVVFLTLIIYAGNMWMNAMGNEETIKKARSIIWEAIVGLAIVMAAYGIATLVIEMVLKSTKYVFL